MFTCSECQALCSTQAALRQHTYVHHGLGSKPAWCRHCNAQGTKASIVLHERRCEQQPRQQCSLCNKSFKNIRALAQHQSSKRHKSRAEQAAKQPIINIQLDLPDSVKHAITHLGPPHGNASAPAYGVSNVDNGHVQSGDIDHNWRRMADDDGAVGGDGSADDHFGHGFGDPNNDDGNNDANDSDDEDVYERRQREAKRRRESAVSQVNSVYPGNRGHLGLVSDPQSQPLNVALDSRALRDLLKSALLHTRHWRDLGTNVTNKQETRTTRANSGKRLLLRYVEWLTTNNAVMQPVVSSEQLVDVNSHTYGLALANALHSTALTAAHYGSPSVWLQMEKDDDAAVAKWLDALKLSKSTAHTALAMLRTLMRWLKHCVIEKQMARAYVREGLVAYLDGFAASADAPLKRLSAYKRATVRAATAKNAELWKTRAEEYARLLYSLYGELMYWISADLAVLVGDKERGDVDAEQIARRTWSLVAVLLSGIGTFAVVSPWRKSFTWVNRLTSGNFG